MNMAPISSRKLDILPLRRAVKKESGTHIKVWREVENLKRKKNTVPHVEPWILTVPYQNTNGKQAEHVIRSTLIILYKFNAVTIVYTAMSKDTKGNNFKPSIPRSANV